MSIPTTSRGHRAPVDAPASAVGNRYGDLEGYRGLAALLIVVYHVYQYAITGDPGLFPRTTVPGRALAGLDAFVELFFVLSAFLLTLPYARSALEGRPSPSGRAFLVRRAARIIPLYLVAVSVVWAIRNPVLPGDWVDLLEHLTFTHVFDDQRIFFTIGPAWSLAVEVQFYLLLALLGWAAVRVSARLSPSRRLALLLGGILALALASLTWKLLARYVLDVAPDDWSVWFGLPAKLDVFAVGMLLAVVVATGRVTVSGRQAVALRLAALFVLAAAFGTRPQGVGEHLWFHSISSIGFGLLLAGSVLGPADRLVRTLGSAVPAFLGLISYSLYLWHEPLLLGLAGSGLLPEQDDPLVFPIGLAALLPLAIIVAWISYWTIEWPAGHLRALVDRRGRARDYYDEE